MFSVSLYVSWAVPLLGPSSDERLHRGKGMTAQSLPLHPPRLANWNVCFLGVGWGWSVWRGKGAGKSFPEWHTHNLVLVPWKWQPRADYFFHRDLLQIPQTFIPGYPWLPFPLTPSPLIQFWHSLGPWTSSTPHPGWGPIVLRHSILDRLLLPMGSGPQERNTFVPPSEEVQFTPSIPWSVLTLGFLLERNRPQFWVQQTPGDEYQVLQADLLKSLVSLD